MRIQAVILAAALLCAAALGETPVSETTLGDQTDVAVTAYNNGLALVRDTRQVSLPAGELHLKFMDVAEQIRPETVSLRSLSKPGSVVIYEQNYEYDLMSPAKLMEKYVGKQVKLVNFSEEIGFGEVAAELLSVDQGPIYKVGDEIYLGHAGNVVLPEIPDDLIATPSLIWLIDNKTGQQTLEATYLTNGVSWQADYVVTLARDERTLDLAGWVTMNNQSGATYTNAKLKLVAGDVNTVERAAGTSGAVEYFLADALEQELPEEEAFAEYHLYTMPRRTTIKQNQSKQLALLDATAVKCAKKYEFRGHEHFHSTQVPPMLAQHVGVFLEFENEEQNGLGIPLPAGVMRIYQEDSEGMLQFAGEDRIEHTPKDENVTLRMGNAFDVIGDRVQKNYRRISPNTHESDYEITLRNHKDSDIVVDVVEPFIGDWRVFDASHEYEQRDARTAVFSVPVPKDGEVTITYSVRVTC